MIIDEVILQKEAYGGRSLVHNRFARRNPETCAGEDDGLFAVLSEEFAERATELPQLFNPKAPAVALRPSVSALKRCIALLSGRETVGGQAPATDEVFEAPDALGWAYQYWNAEEKDRVFEKVRTKKGAKIEGADIVPATQLYTEPYMVKFLVQNSLGALWMGMNPQSKLYQDWEYYVKDADRSPVEHKSILEVRFLDPAVGSGHFLLEAFDLFYAMYEEEDRLTEPEEICAAILNHNLYGIDIDERAVQIATAALWMKAKEKALDLEASYLDEFRGHLVATNIRLPRGKNHLEAFLKRYPDDEPLRPALETVFEGLENAHQLGSLLQIEEPVEKELRYLKGKEEVEMKMNLQLDLFEPVVVQGELPLGVESYEDWQKKTLSRLKEHFNTEAEAADLSEAFFGQSAGKGLALFDLLAKRYDVVAANPPYMGSKNMGTMLKSYVAKQYAPGKRDLYAAFILRCRKLAYEGGRVGMITLQTWMFLSSFVELRLLIIEQDCIDIIAQLGRYAFSEADPPGNVVLFVFSTSDNNLNRQIYAVRLSSPRLANQQARLLAESIAETSSRIRYRVEQNKFVSIPESPLVYWLPPHFFELLAGSTLGNIANIASGISTGKNERFLRFYWEIAFPSLCWSSYSKGGGYARWCGFEYLLINLEYCIRSIQETGSGAVRNLTFQGKGGWTYSETARGSLGVREMVAGTFFDAKGPGLFIRSESINGIVAVLNTRLPSYLLRSIAQALDFDEAYVPRVPIPNAIPKAVSAIEPICLTLKRWLVSCNPTEQTFKENWISRHSISSLFIAINANLSRSECIAAVLHAVEGINEKEAFTAYEVADDDIASVIDEVGTPAGWFPLICKYDTLVELPSELPEIPQELLNILENCDRLTLSTDKLTDIKRCLRNLYESGSGAKVVNDEDIDTDTSTDDEADEEESEVAVGAHIPIPTETFLEELSVKLEIHPISVYWLLKEGREQEGWRCIPEEKRFTEDTFTVMILRLLGHRWPKQIEAGEPVPDWADKDGIIPISTGAGEQTLLYRVRDRIAAEFPKGNVASIEREFAEIVGTSLEKWLTGGFFKRHISQFKKRPIAWQIESTPASGSRGSRGMRLAPAFSSLVYYHQLDGDLLPKLRTQYIGSLRTRYETELRTLENIPSDERTTDQAGRILQLQNWIEELNAFDQKLSEAATTGFCPNDTKTLKARLRQLAIDDATLCLKVRWLRKLMEVMQPEPLETWKQTAQETKLHPGFPNWIEEALTHLDHHCSAVGTQPPDAANLTNDPTSADLAKLICKEAKSMVNGSLSLACQRWWAKFNETLLVPLRQQIKDATEETKQLKDELKQLGTKRDDTRRDEINNTLATLKAKIKNLKAELEQRTAKGSAIRLSIETWKCPEAETWEPWLSSQPLYDAISSLDGRRNPPKTVAEFVAQESAYVPDLNDGVRVNIAPLQKAGLLAAEVIAKKDVEKAISDRAEWRADERRWCRGGKLPQPGWWK